VARNFLGSRVAVDDTVMLETARDPGRTTRRTKASDDTLEADHLIMPHVSEPTVKEAKRRRLSFAERIARELAPTKDCLLDDGPSTSRWGNITARTRKQHEGALPEAGDDVWEVARLVDKRTGGGGRIEYLVRRWLLYP
jgi:hypothetical protein